MKHEVDDEGMPVLRVRTFDAEGADEDSAAADDDAAMIPSPDTVSAILEFDDASEGSSILGLPSRRKIGEVGSTTFGFRRRLPAPTSAALNWFG